MSNIELLEPFLNQGLKYTNFFNGRLLSAEDLSAEQEANRSGHHLLGQAIGDGIAYGLEVAKAAGAGNQPVVTVQPGLAINRCGDAVRLPLSVDLTLVRPATSTAPVNGAIFTECKPPQPGVFVANEGIYLLTVAPAWGREGRAQISGLDNGAADCNTKSLVEGVRFNLHWIAMTNNELSDGNRLRNLVAFKCFGGDAWFFKSRPLGPPPDTYGAIDGLRATRLSDSEVPLAVLYWAGSAGIRFVDLWPARRRSIDPATTGRWKAVAGDRKLAEAEAIFLQFQDHLEDIRQEIGLTAAFNLRADQRFRYLPAAGYLPDAFTWRVFLGPMAPPSTTLVDASQLRSIIIRSFLEDPIRTGSFADAAKQGMDPPVPLTVYKEFGDPGFVVFARSARGRIRVFLSSTNASIPPENIGVLTGGIYAESDIETNRLMAFARTGGMFTIPEVPPGNYRVRVSAQNFETPAPRTVPVIAGRTIDLGFALAPVLTGSIILIVIDASGAVIPGISSTVTNIATGITSARPTDQAGRAVFNNLPPGQYDIVAGIAEEIGSSNGVTVTSGAQVQITLQLSPREQARPKTFVEFKALKKPPLGNGQFGMMIDLEGRLIKFEEAPSSGANNFASKAQAKQTVQWRARSEGIEAKKNYARNYVEGMVDRAQLLQPWLNMAEIQPMPSNVKKWLLEWRGYFAESDSRIGKKSIEPTIFVNKNYTPPKSRNDIPSEPQAYAVFGDFGAPLLVMLDEAVTKRPVTFEEIRPPLLREPIWKILEQYGLVYPDQLAAFDYRNVAKILDLPEEVARLTILQAAEKVKEINLNRRYYDGMDDQVNGVLNALGLKDDVAIANADPNQLAGELSRRLDNASEASLTRQLQAQQLLSQAREIVAPEAWSLEFAGFTPGQVSTMIGRGIVSKGDLISKIDSDQARGQLAQAIGLSKETVAGLQNTVLKQLTASSLNHDISTNLLTLSGVNATIATKLGEANLDTVEKVAGASEEEIINATGFSADWAAKLKTNAVAVSSGGRELSSLASISNEEAETLSKAGITRVIDLKNKDAGTITQFINQAFGGKPQQAATVLEKLAPIIKGGAIR